MRNIIDKAYSFSACYNLEFRQELATYQPGIASPETSGSNKHISYDNSVK